MHCSRVDPRREVSAALLLLLLLSSPTMKQYSPESKHHILLQHASNPALHSFSSLARSLGGGLTARTLQRWQQQWDGAQQSLERREGSGRPRLLDTTQVNNLIRTPIKNKNRAHTPVHYPQLMPIIRKKIGKEIHINTIRNYGRRDCGIRLKHTKKRTTAECKYEYKYESE